MKAVCAKFPQRSDSNTWREVLTKKHKHFGRHSLYLLSHIPSNTLCEFCPFSLTLHTQRGALNGW